MDTAIDVMPCACGGKMDITYDEHSCWLYCTTCNRSSGAITCTSHDKFTFETAQEMLIERWNRERIREEAHMAPFLARKP